MTFFIEDFQKLVDHIYEFFHIYFKNQDDIIKDEIIKEQRKNGFHIISSYGSWKY